MAILNPYLNFEGNAREAIEFYQSVFGGDVNIMAFGDMGMTEHEGNAIPADGVMHGQLTTTEGFTLMASDNVPVRGPDPNGHLSLSGAEDELLRGYWDKLADGGRIDVPLEVAWGDAFGQVKDRFGINWLVNIAGPGQQTRTSHPRRRPSETGGLSSVLRSGVPASPACVRRPELHPPAVVRHAVDHVDHRARSRSDRDRARHIGTGARVTGPPDVVEVADGVRRIARRISSSAVTASEAPGAAVRSTRRTAARPQGQCERQHLHRNARHHDWRLGSVEE